MSILYLFGYMLVCVGLPIGMFLALIYLGTVVF